MNLAKREVVLQAERKVCANSRRQVSEGEVAWPKIAGWVGTRVCRTWCAL